MNKKIVILPLFLLLITGCKSFNENVENSLGTYVDKETCVEYFVNYTYGSSYVVTPKYTRKGNVKLNEDCLKGEENETK